MKVGYAHAVITPSLKHPVFLAGFGHNRRAESIHDDLFARALAISDGATTIVLCALDLIGFFRTDVYEVIRQVARPDVHIVIASTHTHHGPDTMGLWGPDTKTRGVDEAWMEVTRRTVTSIIGAALSDLRPAMARWASVRVPGVAKNFRDPAITDEELTLLQFLTPEGRPMATLCNFPCHPEVLWEMNPHITSDYVCFLRDEVEQQAEAPALFVAGALGGMMSPDVKDHSFEEAEAMGRRLAQAGIAALTLVESQAASVYIEQRVIKAKLTNPLYKLAFWRKLLPDVRDRKGMLETEVNLIRIGGLWLATVPGELLPKLGLQLKAQMKQSGAAVTGVIGLANDELGYILPLEDFKYPWNPFKPGAHYEETNSIGKDITPKVMNALSELIHAGGEARGKDARIGYTP